MRTTPNDRGASSLFSARQRVVILVPAREGVVAAIDRSTKTRSGRIYYWLIDLDGKDLGWYAPSEIKAES